MINHLYENNDQLFLSSICGISSIIYNNIAQNSIYSNNLKNENFNYFQNSSYSLPQIKLQEGNFAENLIFEDSVKDSEYSLQSYLDYTKCRCRGKSQIYDQDENQSKKQLSQPLSNDTNAIQCISPQIQQNNHHQIDKQITPKYLVQNNEEQDLLSYSNTKKNKATTGIQAKNVTKNIGNLLFKFIWKNRKDLGVLMGIQEDEWKKFIQIIACWRKRNNITRQFLITRWHAQGSQAKIFRRISNQYFRKRCLTDIVKSNIRLKRIHYERIYRFQQSIIDAEGLSSIV